MLSSALVPLALLALIGIMALYAVYRAGALLYSAQTAGYYCIENKAQLIGRCDALGIIASAKCSNQKTYGSA
jgi:hypothetical protein